MKIGIIGTGQVGAACAFACVMRGVGTQLVLVDHNPALAKAQAEDILHATPFSESIPVTHGDIDALAGCGIVMIAAGVPQKDPSETRLQLLARNAEVFAEVIPQILKAAPDAILLIASNPVDVMTHMAL
ncbi:MAG: NAD(P)-binding domain-containing protein, partial [Pseudomonadota bacterium]